MLKYHFRNSTRIYDSKIKTFTDKSTWTPPIKLMSENTINTICNIENLRQSETLLTILINIYIMTKDL